MRENESNMPRLYVSPSGQKGRRRDIKLLDVGVNAAKTRKAKFEAIVAWKSRL